MNRALRQITVCDHYLGNHPRLLVGVVVLILLVALVLTWTKGARHDYKHHYLPIWDVTMAGGDPWQATGSGGNAYGPAFCTLAPLAALHPLLPKYLMVTCWFGLALWYFFSTRRGNWPALGRSPARSVVDQGTGNVHTAIQQQFSTGNWLLAYFFLNPLFWIEFPIYGLLDILLACLCIAALYFHLNGRSAQAGVLIAAGTLFKFYPAVLVPLFALQRRRGDWNFVTSFLAVTGVSMGLAYLLWGTSILDPILWATDRPSKHLSIFRFLQGPLSPTPDLDWLSGPCTLIATLGVIWYCHRHRMTLPLASFATLLTLFTFYKVGHVHYLALLLGLFPYLLLTHR